MFKEMRRKDKKMPDDLAIQLLEKADDGVLGTNCVNGYPYLTPLNFVYFKGKVYFHSAKEGGKIDNIQADHRVSFSVVGDVELQREEFDTSYKSVIIFGQAHEVVKDERMDALWAIIRKYSPDFIVKGEQYIEKFDKATKVFSITIEHMTGKHQ